MNDVNCQRCGADVPILDLSAQVKQNISNTACLIGRMQTLIELKDQAGLGLAEAKSVAFHLSDEGGKCHRCHRELPEEKEVVVLSTLSVVESQVVNARPRSIERAAEQALTAHRNQRASHRHLAASAVVSRPLKCGVSLLRVIRRVLMRRYVFRVLVTLLTLSLGIAIGIWFMTRDRAPVSSTANVSISIPDEKDDSHRNRVSRSHATLSTTLSIFSLVCRNRS